MKPVQVPLKFGWQFKGLQSCCDCRCTKHLWKRNRAIGWGRILYLMFPAGRGTGLTVGYYYLPDGHSVQFDGVLHMFLPSLQQSLSIPNGKVSAFAFEKPKSLNSTLDDQHKWMSDKSFSDWLVSVKAEHDVRALFDEASQK